MNEGNFTMNDNNIYEALLKEARGHYIQGDLNKAADYLLLAIDLNNDDAENYSNLGMIRMMQGRFKESIKACEESIKKNPRNSRIIANMAGIYIKLGEPETALHLFKKARDIEPMNEKNHNDLLFSLHCADIPEDAIFLEHRRFGLLFEKGQIDKMILPPHQKEGEKIRLGYILTDIPEHAVWHILRAILPNHNREKFELYIYWANEASSKSAEGMKGNTDIWREVSGADNETLSAIIKGDKIDILFDLSGHTGGNRLPVFAMRSAPIQISWFGYMDTSGLMNMDYRLTDKFRVPEERKHLYTEKLVYLPESYTFDPIMTPAPDQRDLPANKNGCITFGSFNTIKKLNKQILSIWGQILKILPASNLILVADPSEERQKEIKSILVEAGAREEQIRIVDTLPLQNFLLLLRQEIDIALDTYPYSGGATVQHALSQGVPSITLCGKKEFERNGSAIMAAAGFPEFITQSPEEYIDKAIILSSNTELLTRVRLEAPDKIGTNKKDVVLSVENALEDIAKKHRDFIVK
ncbi:MAG: tetratricopeptide repeat protein [bacterium]|nr:tetratricopeptide repeat protein [bacterium]